MREERFKQAIRLRLLAFVLAFALTWYAINPAPGSIPRVKRDEEQPDENRLEAKTAFSSSHRLTGTEIGVGVSSVDTAPGPKPNELDWPEIIDIGED